MSTISSHQALELATTFSQLSDRMATADSPIRARIYEIATRVACLRAQALAKSEEAKPVFGRTASRSIFAVA